jgi:hypothetical protein
MINAKQAKRKGKERSVKMFEERKSTIKLKNKYSWAT